MSSLRPHPQVRPRIPTPLAAVAVSQLSMTELLSALSHALDLTEGSPPNHTLRSGVIGMRLAEELGMSTEERSALYFALLLKDSGCSSNAARVSVLFGADDHAVKREMKTQRDEGLWGRMRAMLSVTAPDAHWIRRAALLMRMPRPSQVEQELLQIRCDRGSLIARQLGFPAATSEAIAALDERWDGTGYPRQLAGDAIPLLARIAALAQTLDVFLQRPDGATVTWDMLAQRRGRWFDPRLVRIVERWRTDRNFWHRLESADVTETFQSLAPTSGSQPLTEGGIDVVAQAFADIVDAKSPFTYRHSANVATLASSAAAQFTAAPEELRRVRRAGLLHDLGKLGVSNSILDKPAALTSEERRSMEAHPQHTWDILSGIGAFRDFAMLAAVHHEKLDGSGYCWGFHGDELGPFERVLAVADGFEALTANRPYRAPLTRDEALAILRREEPTRLCPTAIDAVAVATA